MKNGVTTVMVAVLTVAAVGILSGCQFRQLKKEIAEYDASYALAGQVSLPSKHRATVIVVLLEEKENGKVPLRYALCDDAGHFSLIVEAGEYYLAAFEDLNENFRHDPGEYAGFFGNPSKIVTPKVESGSTAPRAVRDLNIHLSPTKESLTGLEITADMASEQMPVFKAGVLARLDDPLFAQQNGTMGFWKPLTFIKQFGAGIYFLEPYDPQRIPVLFVHGANGTPTSFKPIIERLDKKRFQTWLYYYPSGIRLDASANILEGVLRALHEKYGFDRLFITAHSMGGLVSRRAILKSRNEYHQDYIKLFVSIATPWGGVQMAQKGVDNAPAAIPSWHDVVPESEYIRRIYKQKLSPGVPFHLFFAYKGNCSLFMANNDGAIELLSALDNRAQSDALSIRGFYEEHTDILASDEMIDRYLLTLESTESGEE